MCSVAHVNAVFRGRMCDLLLKDLSAYEGRMCDLLVKDLSACVSTEYTRLTIYHYPFFHSFQDNLAACGCDDPQVEDEKKKKKKKKPQSEGSSDDTSEHLLSYIYI